MPSPLPLIRSKLRESRAKRYEVQQRNYNRRNRRSKFQQAKGASKSSKLDHESVASNLRRTAILKRSAIATWLARLGHLIHHDQKSCCRAGIASKSHALREIREPAVIHPSVGGAHRKGFERKTR